jgi:hypothetical protein
VKRTERIAHGRHRLSHNQAFIDALLAPHHFHGVRGLPDMLVENRDRQYSRPFVDARIFTRQAPASKK